MPRSGYSVECRARARRPGSLHSGAGSPIWFGADSAIALECRPRRSTGGGGAGTGSPALGERCDGLLCGAAPALSPRPEFQWLPGAPAGSHSPSELTGCQAGCSWRRGSSGGGDHPGRGCSGGGTGGGTNCGSGGGTGGGANWGSGGGGGSARRCERLGGGGSNRSGSPAGSATHAPVAARPAVCDGRSCAAQPQLSGWRSAVFVADDPAAGGAAGAAQPAGAATSSRAARVSWL